MKRRGERRWQWGEGGLIAFALVLALCLCAYRNRTPPMESMQPVHALLAQTLERVEMVNLNAADVEELTTLSGIGRALAERIVEYRQEHGDFSCIEEVMNVPGIGMGKFAAMQTWIYVE